MRQTLIKLSCSICLLLTPITSSATSYLFYKWLPNLYINFTNDRNSSQPPTVTFSFNNDNTCEGTDIQFTSNVSGENGAITYSWNFGDGGTSTDANPIYAYNNVTNGCGTQTYTVSLVVTDNDGPHTAVTNTVSVIRSPNLTIEDDDNPFGEPFNNCASASPNFEINVDVGSSDSSCIDTYMVDWGDGSPTETFNSLPTTPVNHIYTQIGLYSMTWTATSDDGCITEVTTIVKNVSNPSGAVVSPGNTNNLCAPTELLQFTITNWGQNSDDTTYDIDFGDGTTISLNQATLQASPYYDAGDPENSADYPIPHAYLASSCESGSGYTIELNITNACDTTTSQLVDITVLTGADADFDWTGDQCVNNTILFSSTSELGYNPNCTQNAIYNWDFGDGTVLTDVGANESHTYTNPGTYNVTMSVEMYCGISEITRQICIEDTPAPLFNLSTLEGCIPLNVNATNTTVATACSATSYLWDVTYTAANCETVENWQFVGGTDQTSENPQFQFYNAGFYDITLTATNNCGTEVSSSQRISVKRPPTANINPIPNYCGAVTINPTTNIEICTDDPSEVTYNWSFPGGTPASSNSENPGSINYSTPGNHTVTLEVTNSCGTVTTNETFTIVEQPNITVQPLANQTLCQNATPTDLVVTATASTGTLTYQWYVNSVNNTTTGAPIAGATNATYTPPTNAVGILYYYVIVSQQAEPSCNQVSTIAEVEVLTAPIFTVQPDDSAVCLNGTPNILEVAYTNGTGTPTYQWYSNTVDSTTGGTLIPGATNATYNPPTTSIGTLYYYCVISFTSGGCSQIFSETAQVDVTPGVSID
ncbi:PKD domain-containing protein, partial [Urechidicola sp. KH5]